MKNNKKLIQTIILVALGSSFVSIEKVSLVMNMFLLPSIAFIFTGSMIFLIHEKQIIKNFTSTYKEGLKAALVSSLLFYSVYLTIYVLSSLASFVILLSSYSTYKILKKKKDYFLLLFSIISLTLAFLIPSVNDNLIVKIPLITFSFLGETVLMFMLKEVKIYFNEKPKETLFFANSFIGIISVALFFLTKSDSVAILSRDEQIHLFILTFISTFLISYIIIMKPMSAQIDRLPFIVSVLISSVILSLFSFSLSFVCAIFFILLSLFFPKKTNGGFAVTEFIAILTLIAIVISLLFPVYTKIRSKLIVRNDRNLCMSHQPNSMENTFKYGNYFIKYIDGKPKYLYLLRDSFFRSFSIE